MRINKNKQVAGDRGSIVLTVLLAIMAATALIGLLFLQTDSLSSTANSFYSRGRAFLASESARQVATEILHDYFFNNPNASSEEARAYLEQTLPKLMPTGYGVKSVDLEILKPSQYGPIPNGAFAGIEAPMIAVKLQVSAYYGSSDADRVSRGFVDVDMVLAQVSMFQFILFLDLPYGDWDPGPQLDLNGRVHANGDVCLGGSLGSRFQRLTVFGRLMNMQDGRCLFTSFFGNTSIADSPAFTQFRPLTKVADNGCVNCDGTGLDWKEYALLTWKNQALDQAHHVPRLRLPGAAFAHTQASVKVSGKSTRQPESNRDGIRYLIDPVRANDDPQVKKEKFAYKADLRIIDGVWYLRDPGNEDAWPGIPIWSDHSGRTRVNNIGIGQEDLREARLWPAAEIPHRYSYYEYDPVTGSIADNDAGVVSYGTLAGTLAPSPGSQPRWRPGQSLEAPASMCSTSVASCAGGCGFQEVFDSAIACASGAPSPGAATYLLNATRAGFLDGHIFADANGDPSREAQSHVLPMNFDVDQFQQALMDDRPGELGSYFSEKRPFNGIVFISNNWPGSLDGFDDGWSQQPPPQGANADFHQIDVTSPSQQQALPYQLCSDQNLITPGGLAGSSFDQTSGQTRFQIPACDSYGASELLRAYPSVVRIHNASILSPKILPKGLSVVSNLPVYLLGDFNSSSDASSADSKNWVPSLVAGDQVTVLSNNWTDDRGGWNDSPAAKTAGREVKDNVKLNLALLSGWLRYQRTMPLHAFPAMLEDWSGSGKVLEFNGSVVIGFRPVYHRNGRYFSFGSMLEEIYGAPTRIWKFDPHFARIGQQPPGTPYFGLSAISRWTRF